MFLNMHITSNINMLREDMPVPGYFSVDTISFWSYIKNSL